MSSDTSTWMPLYVADYLKDTRHLSTTEHGAYFLLILHAWTHEGALPQDSVRLARVAGLSAKEWKESGPILLEFFREADGAYRHKRVDEELAKASANVEQRRAAGKASAEARKAKRNGNERSNDRSTSVGTERPTDVQRNGRPSPSPIEEAKASPEASRAPTREPGRPIRFEGKEIPFSDALLRTFKAANIVRTPSTDDQRHLRAWIDAGADLQVDVLDVAARIARRQEEIGKSIGMLKYLDGPVHESIEEGRREREHLREVGERYAHLPKPVAAQGVH